MLRRLITFAVLLFITRGHNCWAQDNMIGVYFDTSASSNCISGRFYEPIEAYIVLVRPSSPSGVGGWEARISWDTGAYVTLNSLAAGSTNIQTFPDFQVGLSSPLWLPEQAPLILATITIFATQPAGIYLGASSSPSLPGSSFPVYAEGVDPSVIHVTAINNDGAGGPCAYIATEQCAMDSVASQLVWPYDVESWEVVEPVSPTTLSRSRLPEMPSAVDSLCLQDALYHADLCCIGRVTNQESRCLQKDGLRRAASVVLLSIEREFFGPALSVVSVYVPDTQIDNCVGYHGFSPRPRATSLREGVRVFVMAYWQGGCYRAGSYGLIFLDDNSAYSSALTLHVDPELTARRFADSIALQTQKNNATAIIKGQCITASDNTYAVHVLKKYGGADIPERIRVLAAAQSSFYGSTSVPSGESEAEALSRPHAASVLHLVPGANYILYLDKVSEALYRVRNQRWGAYMETERGQVNDHSAFVRIPATPY